MLHGLGARDACPVLPIPRARCVHTHREVTQCPTPRSPHLLSCACCLSCVVCWSCVWRHDFGLMWREGDPADRVQEERTADKDRAGASNTRQPTNAGSGSMRSPPHRRQPTAEIQIKKMPVRRWSRTTAVTPRLAWNIPKSSVPVVVPLVRRNPRCPTCHVLHRCALTAHTLASGLRLQFRTAPQRCLIRVHVEISPLADHLHFRFAGRSRESRAIKTGRPRVHPPACVCHLPILYISSPGVFQPHVALEAGMAAGTICFDHLLKTSAVCMYIVTRKNSTAGATLTRSACRRLLPHGTREYVVLYSSHA